MLITKINNRVELITKINNRIKISQLLNEIWLSLYTQVIFNNKEKPILILLLTVSSFDVSGNSLKALAECIAEVCGWMLLNMLKLNDDKTEFLLIASPYYIKTL